VKALCFMGFARNMTQKVKAIGFVNHVAKIVFFIKNLTIGNLLGTLFVYISIEIDRIEVDI
jgi:hypothetical protein